MAETGERLDEALELLATLSGHQAPFGSLWEHRRGGRYVVMDHGLAEASLEPLVVYVAETGGPRWIRTASEFMDGRFRRVRRPDVSPPAHDGDG